MERSIFHIKMERNHISGLPFLVFTPLKTYPLLPVQLIPDLRPHFQLQLFTSQKPLFIFFFFCFFFHHNFYYGGTILTP